MPSRHSYFLFRSRPTYERILPYAGNGEALHWHQLRIAKRCAAMARPTACHFSPFDQRPLISVGSDIANIGKVS